MNFEIKLKFNENILPILHKPLKDFIKVRCIGTVDIFVLAKKNKLIKSLKTAFSSIKQAGFYISDDLVNSIINNEQL